MVPRAVAAPSASLVPAENTTDAHHNGSHVYAINLGSEKIIALRAIRAGTSPAPTRLVRSQDEGTGRVAQHTWQSSPIPRDPPLSFRYVTETTHPQSAAQQGSLP